MGIVIATGLSIGTLFTLFVVPAFYLVLARRHGAQPQPAALPVRRQEPDAKRELAAAP
jgi:multidrug efflux pump